MTNLLTGLIGYDMKHQMIEYQKLINQLRAVRADLDEKTITAKVQEMAHTNTTSTLDHLRHCVHLGMRGDPMPWEAS
ncbi:MAG: hypothetical protein OQK24_15145 [Magnetovibrio sp.]|nr:hypothetical protein [Magnetovibrio sp.]